MSYLSLIIYLKNWRSKFNSRCLQLNFFKLLILFHGLASYKIDVDKNNFLIFYVFILLEFMIIVIRVEFVYQKNC